MNSNFGKRSSGSTNSFDFDLGLGSSQGRPLNGQKSQTSSYSSSNSQPRPAWQPGKPSWTHQPAPKQTTIRSEIGSGPTSMVGDIHGKTWGSSTGSGSGIGIVIKDPSLFGDLVGSAIGKSSGNVPLKKAPPASASGSNKSSYSMGNLADSLPKPGNSTTGGGGWGYGSKPGGFSGGYASSGGMNPGVNANSSNKTPNLGGPSMKSMSGSNLSGSGLPSNGDPFGSLLGFGSKPSGSKTGKANNNNTQSDAFGKSQSSFQSTPNGGGSAGSTAQNNDFAGFQNAAKSNAFSTSSFDAFGEQSSGPQHSSANDDDPLGMFSASSTTAAPAAQPQVEDWGFESFDGGAGSTTELDGLPPPPPGVSATSAKSKGIDNQRQGQYADAIKWLSWAVILMEKAGDQAGSAEVLSTRASCYKEVGEYKKAVADCTKLWVLMTLDGINTDESFEVLDHDKKNVSIMVQRALLYESMEKYKLGAEDLRMVLKIDPGNRIARSTVHRLTKMAG
ncbi:unnamed protein product [Thlaspi arvense]|uniref:Uncharacterized protein n=1 Tax=Thlaspi arvense TaxID=13288 RepID=A0AAU9S004_THLAR|nr:unnamed protein product [Thlaspi arvense]